MARTHARECRICACISSRTVALPFSPLLLLLLLFGIRFFANAFLFLRYLFFSFTSDIPPPLFCRSCVGVIRETRSSPDKTRRYGSLPIVVVWVIRRRIVSSGLVRSIIISQNRGIASSFQTRLSLSLLRTRGNGFCASLICHERTQKKGEEEEEEKESRDEQAFSFLLNFFFSFCRALCILYRLSPVRRRTRP